MPCSPPGDFPNPGIEPASLMSPALAGGFFTTSTTRKPNIYITICKIDRKWDFCVIQGAQPTALWQPRKLGWGERREGGSGDRGHFCIPVADSMYGRNQHSIIKQLSCNFLKGGKGERETLNWRKSIWKSYSLLSPWAYPGCRWIVLNSNCPLESSDNFSKAWWRGPILRPIKSTSLEIGLLKLPDYFSVQPGLRVSAVSAEEFKFQSRNLGGGEWVDTLLDSLSRKNRKGALIAL